MSKIARYVGNLIAFASGAVGTERTVFGDVTQSDVLTDNITADFIRGWANGVDINGFPPEQFFNAVSFVSTQLMAYLHQMGIAEWDVLQEYHIGSLTNVSGVIFKSLTNTNIGNDPASDTINWEKEAVGEVKTTVLTVSDPTWVPDSRTKSIEFIATGGGGGGGGVDGQGVGTAAVAGSGAAGATAIKSTIIIDATYAIVIGAGGTGGAAGNNAGSAGGTTTITSASITISTTGGSGGSGDIGTSGTSLPSGVAGGAATGGDLNIDGGGTMFPAIITGAAAGNASGAASFWGGGARGVDDSNGIDSATQGAGGGASSTSGSATNYSGGDGADGVIIIKEYS